MTFASGTRLGRYEIRSKLGEGGMGEVYLAEDTLLHRKVAIKFLSTEVVQNRERLARFEQEDEPTCMQTRASLIGKACGTSALSWRELTRFTGLERGKSVCETGEFETSSRP